MQLLEQKLKVFRVWENPQGNGLEQSIGGGGALRIPVFHATSEMYVQRFKNRSNWNYLFTGRLVTSLCTMSLVPSALPHYKAHLHFIKRKWGMRYTNAYHFICSKIIVCFYCKEIYSSPEWFLVKYFSKNLLLPFMLYHFASNLLCGREVKELP